ncbi:MAG: radical SAM protein [Elusimicrobiales bacterium]|nr:radical SAM protein [Elusimicrobiales bacterium]
MVESRGKKLSAKKSGLKAGRRPAAAPRPEKRFDPDYVALDLTYKCNLACSFCFMSKSRSKAAPGGELTLKELKELVDGLSQRPRKFYLAGGEPSLKKGLVELVRHIKKRGHFCRITTNAFGLDKKSAGLLMDAGLDEFTVSLHGEPAVHDKLVGARGAAARIEELFRLVDSREKRNTTISAWCTVTGLNHSRLYRAYRYFRSLNPDSIMFSHMDYITERDLAVTREVLRSQLGSKTVLNSSEGLVAGVSAAVLAGEIKKIKADSGPAVNFFPNLSAEEMKGWYAPGSGFQKRGFCLAQWKGLWIGPRGEVVPCQPLGHEMGNIRKTAPLDVFSGKPAADFRKALLRRGGFLPTCSRCGRSSYSSTYCVKAAVPARVGKR